MIHVRNGSKAATARVAQQLPALRGFRDLRARRIGLIAITLLGVPWALFALANRQIQRETLPSKFKLGWFYAEGSCGGFRAYAFGLSEWSAKEITQQGIAYFADIDASDHAAVRQMYHGEWKATPLPPSFFGDGLASILHCGEKGSLLWPTGMTEALKRSGSYYRQSGMRVLFVLPQLGLVVGVSD